MRQIFENVLKAKFSKLFNHDISNSYNNVQNNFYGPVNFIYKNSKEIKTKTPSLLYNISKKNKTSLGKEKGSYLIVTAKKSHRSQIKE